MDHDALGTRNAESTSKVLLCHDGAVRSRDAIRGDMHSQPAAGTSSSGFSFLSRRIKRPRASRPPNANDNSPKGHLSRLPSQTPRSISTDDRKDSSFSQCAEDFLSPQWHRLREFSEVWQQTIGESENDIEVKKKYLLSMLPSEVKEQRESIFLDELYLAFTKTTIEYTKTKLRAERNDEEAVLEQPRRRVTGGWLLESIRRLQNPSKRVDSAPDNLFKQISHFFLVSIIETNQDTVFKGRSLPSNTDMINMFLMRYPQKIEDRSDDIGRALRGRIGMGDVSSYCVEDVLNRLENEIASEAQESRPRANPKSTALGGAHASLSIENEQQERANDRSNTREPSTQNASHRVYDPAILASRTPSASILQNYDMDRSEEYVSPAPLVSQERTLWTPQHDGWYPSEAEHESEREFLARYQPPHKDIETLDPIFLTEGDLRSLQYQQCTQQPRFLSEPTYHITPGGGHHVATEHSDLMEDDDTLLHGTPYAEATLNEDEVQKTEQLHQSTSQPDFSGRTRPQAYDPMEGQELSCDMSQSEGSSQHSREQNTQLFVETAFREKVPPKQVSETRLIRERLAGKSAEEWKHVPSIEQIPDDTFVFISPSPGPSMGSPALSSAESQYTYASEQTQEPAFEQDTATDDQSPTFESQLTTGDRHPTFEADYPSENVTMEDVQDTHAEESAESASSQSTARRGARPRISEAIILISSQPSKSPQFSLNIGDTDLVSDDEDKKIDTSIHPMLAAVSPRYVARTTASGTPTSSASIIRTPKTKLPPHLASSRKAAHRKSLDPFSAIPTPEEKLLHSQQEYPLVDIVDEKVIGGKLKYRIKWERINGMEFEDTWEPAENANAQALRDWERIKKTRTTKAKVMKPKKKQSSVVVAEPDVEMATEPVVEPAVTTAARIIDEKVIGGEPKYLVKRNPHARTRLSETWESAENASDEMIRGWTDTKARKEHSKRYRERYIHEPIARAQATPEPTPQPNLKSREPTKAESELKKILRRQRLARNEKKRQEEKSKKLAALPRAKREAIEKTAAAKKASKEKKTRAKKLAKRLEEQTNKERALVDGSRAGPLRA